MPPLTAITHDWRPGEATYLHLAQLNIPRQFIEDQVAEFVLYWADRGQQNHSWNSKFAKHVMHEWRLHEIAQAKQKAVKPLSAMCTDWKPSRKAIEHLKAQGMTAPFIDDCVNTFIIYWSDRGELHNTWNSKFVAHCEFRHKQANVQANDLRGRSIRDDLTDKSWAGSVPKLTGGNDA